MTSLPDVRVGDVWRDRDPRGGPTFRVTEVCIGIWDHRLGTTPHVWVENVNGTKRRRRIKLARFRSDYELTVRHGWDSDR